jgi:1,2-diacylglycerol 3-alpha-glucosyltransferase
MKILICNTFFYPALGGIENYLLNIARVYVREGKDVTVLTSAYSSELKKIEYLDGIKIIRFPLMSKRFKYIFFEPWILLRSYEHAVMELSAENNFDKCLSRDIFSLVALGKSFPFNRIIYIQATAYPLYIEHSYRKKGVSLKARIYWMIYRILWSAYFGFIERRIINKTKNIIVLSNAKLREITSFYKTSTKNYRVIPPGVDKICFSPCSGEAEKKKLRLKLGLPEDKIIFLYVGRFEKEKNPEGILEAIRGMDVNPMHFVFVGNSDEYFIQKIVKYKLDKYITLTGTIFEPADYYRCSDTLLLPSFTEGFGQVIIEGMASGIPVIAFKNPEGKFLLSTDELIKTGETGILVNYADYNKFGEAIRFLADNPEVRLKMGLNGLSEVKQRYSWKSTASQILDFE